MNNTTMTGANAAGLFSFDKYTSIPFITFQAIILLIALVGIVGNGMSLYILADNKAKYAFATYLKALTSADVCILTNAIVRFAVDMSGYFINKDTFDTVKAYEQVWIGSFVAKVLQQLAACFITIISVERFVAVIFPLKAKMFILDRHPEKVVSVVLVVYVAMSIPTLVFSEIVTIVDPNTNITTKVIRYSGIGRAAIPFFSVFVVAVKFIIPLTIVVSTTLAIVYSLRRQRAPGDCPRTSGIKGCMERDKMTRVLIVIATFFTCNTIIGLSISVIIMFFQDDIKRQPLLYLLLQETRRVLVGLNAANDFIVYTLSSKKFRKLFMAKFCSRRMVSDNTLPGTLVKQDTSGSIQSTSSSEISYSDKRSVSDSIIQP